MCLFKEIVYYILTLIVWRRPGGVTKGVKGGGGGGETSRQAGWEVELPLRNGSTYYSIVSQYKNH